MLNFIIAFSIRNKLIVGLFILALIAWGIDSYQKLPIDAVPDITNNQVQVITSAPSLGATDIERLVTFPIELANSNIAGLKEMRSFSRFGLSLVSLVFEDDVDVYWARQQVAERLQTVQNEIPKGIGEISMGPITTGLGEIYQYTVKPEPGFKNKYSLAELRSIQDWIVRRQLLGIKGVADVSSFGGQLKQYEIAVDPARLNAHNVSMQEVFEAVETNNQNTGGAYLEKGPSVLYIRTEGLIGTEKELGGLFIRNEINGNPIFLRDVAEVRLGNATRYGAMCYNNDGEVCGGIVMMLKGENSAGVIERVKARVNEIQKILPEGIKIEAFLDRTKMVNNAIGTVKTNLIEGALIVIFILVLFLGNIRAGFIVASVIPLSMLFTVGMMHLVGGSGNLMSFGALDFGLIVDGAVIIVEAVLHQLTHNKRYLGILRIPGNEIDGEVKSSAGKMMNSAVFGQIIILIVYLPIFSLQGIEGKMFIPMAQAVSFALLGAFLLSLTYVPMMCSLMLRYTRGNIAFSDRAMNFLSSIYTSSLKRALSWPYRIIGGSLLIFILALITLSQMGGEFIPELEEGDFAVETRVLKGSNLNTSIASCSKAAGILKERFPEVEKVVTKIGSGEIPTDPMPIDAADMMVILKDKNEWTSANSFDELAEKMTAAVSEVPGITVSFQFPVQMRFNELLTGAKQDVVCKIFGENIDSLSKYAHSIGQIAAKIDGVTELFVEPVMGMPQLVIGYNRAMLASFGLSVDQANHIVNMALAGQKAGFVYEDEKRFEVVIRMQQEKKSQLSAIENLLIPAPNGQQIPLRQIAEIEEINGPNQIQREDAKRRIFVGFNVRGRDVESVVNELQKAVQSNMQMASGYTLRYGGAFENLNAAKERLSITLPVALLLIFLMLYFSFRSVKLGMLIYSAIPLSAAGGIFALYIRDMPFSISAGIGFIALFGVSVLNGIVLIAEFQRLKESGITDSIERVILGTKTRLRPVLMTAMVASMGFLPMALSNGAGAEVQRPLATVVIGGLLIATFLTLYVLPCLYLLFHVERKRRFKTGALSIIVVLISISGATSAQQSISYWAARDSALKNNFTLNAGNAAAASEKSKIGTAGELQALNIGGAVGQINSAYADQQFSVLQQIDFPLSYRQKKLMLTKNYEGAQLANQITQFTLEQNLELLFYEIVVLRQKKNLRFKNDSLLASLEAKEKKRFELGESDVLMLTDVQLRRGKLSIELDAIEALIRVAELQFNVLINCAASYTPLDDSMFANDNSDGATLLKHPRLLLAENGIQALHNEMLYAKYQAYPRLQLGFQTMSMQGSGADNVLYDRSLRFQAFQAGIGLPLSLGATSARNKSLKLRETALLFEKEAIFQQLQTQQKELEIKIMAAKKTVRYYHENGLANATLLLERATKQLNEGLINYLEWSSLTLQAIQIKDEYLSAIQSLNILVIQLHYLLDSQP